MRGVTVSPVWGIVSGVGYADTRDMATMRDTEGTVWCPACEDESEWCAVTLAASHPSGYCHLHAFLLGKDEGENDE